MGEPLASPRRSNATASSSASSRLTTTASPGTTSVSAPSTTTAASSSAVWGRNSPTVPSPGIASIPKGSASPGTTGSAHSTFRSAGPLIPCRPTATSARSSSPVATCAISSMTAGRRLPSPITRHPLFEFGGTLAEVRRVDGAIKVEALSITALKGRLDRVANFMKLSRDQQRLLPARPPTDAVEDMLALDVRLPHLSGITGAPVLDGKWNLVDSPGYQPSTGLFFESNGSAVPSVPDVPSDDDLRQARSLLLEEWLGDFPFVEESSRSHAVAALLSQVLRNRIDGPVPLFAVDAPTAGSGKTLLVESIGLVAIGSSPAAMALPRRDEELRKQITSVLLGGTPIILLDNITHTLESGVLAAALTSRNWSDRLLGKSETVSVPNNCLWIATGNNLDFGSELVRRTVWIRLDPKVDRPWERTGFKHDPLGAWVVENRGRLLWALFVLVRRWLADRQAWLAGASRSARSSRGAV